MDENLPRVAIDDLVAATTAGVLRALQARAAGVERIGALDLVKSGFSVDIYIRAGGPRFLEPGTLPGLNPQPEPPGIGG
jgi:hypothetical protein